MITKYLPTFKQIEVNNLTGLRTGYMLSQFPAGNDIAKVELNSGLNFIENGIFVGLSGDLTIENYNKEEHSQIFVHYTEELNTFLDEKKYFAIKDEEIPRAVAMFIGDTITTNNVDLGEQSYEDLEADTKYSFSITDGVATLQDEADEDTAFTGILTSLPNGEDAIELVLVQTPKVVAEVVEG